MEICSYTLKCKKYAIDFAPKKSHVLHQLYDDQEGLYAFFRMPKSKKFYLKLLYSKNAYAVDKRKLFLQFLWKFIGATFLLILLVFLLTWYSLKPIRKALTINDEFIKDILHDFNTPITSMLLNFSMLKEEKQKDISLQRLKHGLDTMLLLQNNLKGFLSNSVTQKRLVNIGDLVQERLRFMAGIYPYINFVYEEESTLLKVTNRELLTRILDNLLSNAAKYNHINGEVKVFIIKDLVTIKDTGKGIKDIAKALERYQTEQERGIGIGLHVVAKLTVELDIIMHINSKVNVGTEVILDFKNLVGKA